MTNFDSARNFQKMAECMIGEALFPTLASPTFDTFPDGRYPDAEFGKGSTRFQGADDFAFVAWPNGDYVIRWKCLTVASIEADSAGSYRVGMECEIVGAVRGRKTPGVDIDEAMHQIATADMGRARECLEKQDSDNRLTAGPFGIQNTDVIKGQGMSPLSNYERIVFLKGSVVPNLKELGPTAVEWHLPFTLYVIVT